MKNILFMMMCLLLLPTATMASTFQDSWNNNWDDGVQLVAQKKGKQKGKKHQERMEKRRAKVEKKIRTFLVLELTDELDLDDAMALKLSSTIETTQKEQHALREKAHMQMQKLKELLADEKTSDSALKKQTDKTSKSVKKARKMDEALFDSISKLLNTRQKAQMLVVLPKIQGKIHRMLQKARKGGHGGKGRMGPRGGGHGGHRGHGGPPPPMGINF